MKEALYEGWGDKQNTFCTEFYNNCKKHRESDGRFTYNVTFNKITKLGYQDESTFKVWQGFIESFCNEQEDLHSEHMKRTKVLLDSFRCKKRYFYQRVYDSIFNVILDTKTEQDKSALVIFINSSRYEWLKDTYEYHYRYLKSLLDNAQIDYCDFDELTTKESDSAYNVVIIIDFITHNDDLKNNCKLIAEYFTKQIPYIGYYSMIKEYTGDEVQRFYKK